MNYKTRNFHTVWLHIFTVPFIWSPLFIALVLDLFAEIYHRVCFPIYGLKYIERKKYIQVWDRPQLEYLNFIEKIGCAYCGYMNGLFPYLAAICQSSETYWCGIMHKERDGFTVQQHQIDGAFTKFGDEAEFDIKYTSQAK